MPLLLSLVIGGILLFSVALGLVYRFYFSLFVRAHFGEESRRDREAIYRRRTFERRCARAGMFIYLSVAAGIARGLEPVLIPELGRLALIVQIAALLIAALCIWSAVSRWREPFDD